MLHRECTFYFELFEIGIMNISCIIDINHVMLLKNTNVNMLIYEK